MSLPPGRPATSIVAATKPEDIAAVVVLFRAYAASLAVDLAYQNFEAEMQAMPGAYAPPSGALLIARGAGDEPLGAVALRPMAETGRCEMKRLYVSPAGRGRRVGERLVNELAATALRIGYREMWLDTLPGMVAAQALYHRLGFEVTAPYYLTPVAGTVFMRRMLG
ncbi:MAG: GNAT family N-acetyltransferase [Alsobacter sp.]